MDYSQKILDSLKSATDTKYFELGSGNLGRVPELFNEIFSGRKAIVIADCNTWEVAGKEVYSRLIGSGIECGAFIFPDREFHADWGHIEELDDVLTRTGAVAVSVGSGTVNDLCKLTAHHHNQSYISVPTAASVDGYSSFGASITFEGLKQTFECPAPVAIVADIDIIARAPRAMTAAGYADLAAKVPCGAEWMIADLFGTEPIQEGPWHMLQDVLDELLSDPEGVARGDKDAIARLFLGLTLSGFAMQAARSSRPASCTDHLFSHYLDMTGHRFNGKFQSHGFQVAIGTLTMCAFFDEFLKMDLSGIDVDACVAAWPSLESEKKRAEEMFKDFVNPTLGPTEISKKYETAEKVRKELILFRDNWTEIKEKIRSQVYSFEKMQSLFKTVGAPVDPADIGVTRQQLKDMVPFTQLMRYRINLLDLGKRAMIYDTLVDRVFGKGGAWEI